jgi:hypothetical protein
MVIEKNIVNCIGGRGVSIKKFVVTLTFDVEPPQSLSPYINDQSTIGENFKTIDPDTFLKR